MPAQPENSTLPAPRLANQVHIAPDVAPVQIPPVTVVGGGGTRTPEQFRQQNLGQGFLHVRRRGFEHVGDARLRRMVVADIAPA